MIVGGGAGGLELAVFAPGNAMGKSGKMAITLVDAARTQFVENRCCIRLPQEPWDNHADELEYFALAQGNYSARLGRMDGLDRDNKSILLPHAG